MLLNKEIKELKEELNKSINKANNSIKDYDTFKENLYTSIQSAFFGNSSNTNMNSLIKKSFNFMTDSPPPKNQQRYNSSTNIHEVYSSKGSNNKKLHESEVVSLTN